MKTKLYGVRLPLLQAEFLDRVVAERYPEVPPHQYLRRVVLRHIRRVHQAEVRRKAVEESGKPAAERG